MQLAIATTTIRNPVLLREFRAMRDDVLFFIAGDLKSPHGEIEALAKELGNTMYLHPEQQEYLGYACVPELPWRCIQRRNIATLEAVRQGADVIYVWDDDNIPVGIDYFDQITRLFVEPWQGWTYRADNGWLNIGAWAQDRYTARGFPYGKRGIQSLWQEPNVTAKIGVASSLILGDPDINATERLESAPTAHVYLRYGGAITPKDTWAPINSQATAWQRELAPLMLLPPGLGRYDDIMGSYLAQRVMQETDYHVYFGQPYVRQERNSHDLIKDLEQELFGMRYTEQFCADLKSVALSPQASILDNLATLVESVATFDYMPAQSIAFMRAWVEDVARIL